MLELIAVGHEQSVGEELMTAICALMEEELVDHPKVHQIALPRLVGLVNGVDGSWSEYRGGLGCDSRWLGKQLKSFSLSDQVGARPGPQRICRPRATTSIELLEVSRRYRARRSAEELTRDRESAPSGNSVYIVLHRLQVLLTHWRSREKTAAKM